MKIIFSKYLPLFLMAIISLNANAIVPVESLILGNFSDQFSERESDPLFYLFKNQNENKSENLISYRKSLALYRGFFEEGKNLSKQCKMSSRVEYVIPNEKVQVKRSVMATLQYVALDLTSRALPQYAKYFEFSRDEYSNLIDGLVGNYCSNNLSIISLKELKNNLLLKYDKENLFQLPTIDSNPLFPSIMKKIISEKLARENEFKYTVKIFKHACSWGGDPQNAGLLIPFLKDSNLMAFIFRQMNSKSIEWSEGKEKIVLKDDAETQPVWCNGLICRKTNKDNFNLQAYRSVGGSSVYEDVKRVYCESERNNEFTYSPKDNDPKLAKIMNSITRDEEILLSSQFIALVTGIPEFLLGVDKFKKADDIFRASVDQSMQDWAEKSVDNFSKILFFEEPLTLELVDRKQYFNQYSPEFKIIFDVNMGEFDRINQDVGKVKVSFEIPILKSFLRYYRQAMLDLRYHEKSDEALLISQFKLQITDAIQKAREKLIIPPWKGDLEAIIVNEIGQQLILKSLDSLNLSSTGSQKIIIEINYAPFALKYINHQFSMLKSAPGK